MYAKVFLKIDIEHVDFFFLLFANSLGSHRTLLHINFLVNSKNELSIIYNDASVLENFHCAKTLNYM